MKPDNSRQPAVIVHDKMQRGCRYLLSAAAGRHFDGRFSPQLTPKQMLGLGVFRGKYMTDCKDEFLEAWFARAKLSPGGRDPSLDCFGVDASRPIQWAYNSRKR